MTLPASGPISLGNFNQELGRASPYTQTISMNDDYTRRAAQASLTSGAGFSLSQGFSKSWIFNYTIPANITSGILWTLATAAGWDGVRPLVATTSGNIGTIGVGYYAFSIYGSYPNGVKLINNHIISGAGGNGGPGHYWPAYGSATTSPPSGGTYTLNPTGSAGGPALYVGTTATIVNNGTIQGGGGGGGGGYNGDYPFGGSGGGGGAGIPAGTGGACQVYLTVYDYGSWSYTDTHNRPGSSGSLTAGGGGGPGGYVGGYGDDRYGNHGGNGGGPGASGGGNVYGRVGTGAGGGSGVAVIGNANITWSTTGTRYGAIT